jgi:hypothetical protein
MKTLIAPLFFLLAFASFKTSFAQCSWVDRLEFTELTINDSCEFGGDSTMGFNSSALVKDSMGIVFSWTVNGQNVDSLTSQNFFNGTLHSYLSYFPESNGLYVTCVAITDTINSCDTTICTEHYRDCASASIFDLDIGLSIFPNPTSTKIYIKNESILRNAKCYLLSAQGRLIPFENDLNGSGLNVPANLLDGIYLLLIYAEDGTLYSAKVQLQK